MKLLFTPSAMLRPELSLQWGRLRAHLRSHTAHGYRSLCQAICGRHTTVCRDLDMTGRRYESDGTSCTDEQSGDIDQISPNPI